MVRTDYASMTLLAKLRLNALPKMQNALARLDRIDTIDADADIRAAKEALREVIPELDQLNGRASRSFWSRVERRGNHLIWTGEGREGPDGAPTCSWNGKHTTAPRVAWGLLREPLSPGENLRKQTDCPYPRCISPDCHRVRQAIPGRTSSTRFDQNGNRVCPFGHTMSSPRHCPTCYHNTKDTARRRLLDATRPHGGVQPSDNASKSTPEEPIYIITRNMEELEAASVKAELNPPPARIPAPDPSLQEDLAALFGQAASDPTV